MKGLLYKEIYLARFNLLFLLVMLLNSIGLIVQVELLGMNDMKVVSVIEILCSFFMYILTNLLDDSYFLNDEIKKWSMFVTATPGTYKEQLLCKYIIIFLESILILNIGFITDTICCMISDNSNYSAFRILFFLFCIFLFIKACIIPFIAYFGAAHGKNVMMAFLGFIIAIAAIWVMFGDISVLMNNRDKGIWVILRMLQSQTVLARLTDLLPYVAVGGYYLSYRISLKLYRKGMAHYEE